jgi:hypothetical protein
MEKNTQYYGIKKKDSKLLQISHVFPLQSRNKFFFLTIKIHTILHTFTVISNFTKSFTAGHIFLKEKKKKKTKNQQIYDSKAPALYITGSFSLLYIFVLRPVSIPAPHHFLDLRRPPPRSALPAPNFSQR